MSVRIIVEVTTTRKALINLPPDIPLWTNRACVSSVGN